MKEVINGLPFFKCIEITYIVYPKDKRVFDLGNICSVTDKFFCDALVHYGKIEDDSYTYIPKIHFEFGQVSKNNPRVEILIKELKEKQMITTAINLQEEDIIEAITAHLISNGYAPEDKEISVTFSENDDEVSASITLADKKKLTRKKRSTIKKTTSKQTTDDVSEEKDRSIDANSADDEGIEQISDDEAIEELTETEELNTSLTEESDDEVSEEDSLFD